MKGMIPNLHWPFMKLCKEPKKNFYKCRINNKNVIVLILDLKQLEAKIDEVREEHRNKLIESEGQFLGMLI